MLMNRKVYSQDFQIRNFEIYGMENNANKMFILEVSAVVSNASRIRLQLDLLLKLILDQ